jgi:UDP-glucose 4-epimerase
MTDPVLVLGAGGFIGHSLVVSLAQAGTPVIAAGGTRTFSDPLVEHVPGRTSEAGLAALLSRAAKVVHLATASTPGTSMSRPLHEVDANLRFTACLLEALQQQPGKPLVYFSSGGALYADTRGNPSEENASLRPRSYHGAAKLASESFISAWCDQHSGSATVLRPSNVYGPGQSEKVGFAIIPTALGKIMRGEELHVWGDGSARRDYVFIDDLLRLCRIILDRPMPAGVRVVNACSGESMSLNELFAAMEAVTGASLRKVYDPARPVDASNIAMNPALAAELFGWRHQTSINDGLTLAWQWLQGKRDR